MHGQPRVHFLKDTGLHLHVAVLHDMLREHFTDILMAAVESLSMLPAGCQLSAPPVRRAALPHGPQL